MRRRPAARPRPRNGVVLHRRGRARGIQVSLSGPFYLTAGGSTALLGEEGPRVSNLGPALILYGKAVRSAVARASGQLHLSLRTARQSGATRSTMGRRGKSPGRTVKWRSLALEEESHCGKSQPRSRPVGSSAAATAAYDLAKRPAAFAPVRE